MSKTIDINDLCPMCEGEGWYWVDAGGGDTDKEICSCFRGAELLTAGDRAIDMEIDRRREEKC